MNVNLSSHKQLVRAFHDQAMILSPLKIIPRPTHPRPASARPLPKIGPSPPPPEAHGGPPMTAFGPVASDPRGLSWFVGDKSQSEPVHPQENMKRYVRHCQEARGPDLQLEIAEQVKGGFRYRPFQDFDEFARQCPQPDQHYYEIIKRGTPAKAYLDIERADYPRADRPSYEALRDAVDACWAATLRRLFPAEYEQHRDQSLWRWLDSSDDQKLSYHAVYDSPLRFANNHEQLRAAVNVMVNDLMRGAPGVFVQHRHVLVYEPQDRPRALACIIDLAVYTPNRAFRLLGSSKLATKPGQRKRVLERAPGQENVPAARFLVADSPAAGSYAVLPPLDRATVAEFTNMRELRSRSELYLTRHDRLNQPDYQPESDPYTYDTAVGVTFGTGGGAQSPDAAGAESMKKNKRGSENGGMEPPAAKRLPGCPNVARVPNLLTDRTDGWVGGGEAGSHLAKLGYAPPNSDILLTLEAVNHHVDAILSLVRGGQSDVQDGWVNFSEIPQAHSAFRPGLLVGTAVRRNHRGQACPFGEQHDSNNLKVLVNAVGMVLVGCHGRACSGKKKWVGTVPFVRDFPDALTYVD